MPNLILYFDGFDLPGPYGDKVDFSVWPDLYGFRAKGNIVAFGGRTDSSMCLFLAW
jgi:hypothetical protein